MAQLKSLIVGSANASSVDTDAIRSKAYENLPNATSLISGIVKIDNNTIKINQSGQIYSVNSGGGGGEIPEDIINHINNTTLHLSSEQITTLTNANTHLSDDNLHLTQSEKANIGKLGVHYASESVHVLGDNLTKLNTSYNHAIDDSVHLSSTDRENINLVNGHVTNTEIHISSTDRENVNSVSSHITNTEIHMSQNDRDLLENVLNANAEFMAHTIDNTKHFVGTEKADTMTKVNRVQEAIDKSTEAYNLASNLAIVKLDSLNHSPKKILITDSSGAVSYHSTIGVDDLVFYSHENISTLNKLTEEKFLEFDGHTLRLEDVESMATNNGTAIGEIILNFNTHTNSHAPSNAQKNVQSNWNATSGDAFILNKPTIPTIPTSLPANGGNADTVNGIKITSSKTAPSNPKVGDIWITW